MSSPVKQKEHVSEMVFGHWVLGHGQHLHTRENTSNTRRAEPVSRFSLLSVCFVCLTVEELHLFRVQKLYETHLSGANLIGRNHNWPDRAQKCPAFTFT